MSNPVTLLSSYGIVGGACDGLKEDLCTDQQGRHSQKKRESNNSFIMDQAAGTCSYPGLPNHENARRSLANAWQMAMEATKNDYDDDVDDNTDDDNDDHGRRYKSRSKSRSKRREGTQPAVDRSSSTCLKIDDSCTTAKMENKTKVKSASNYEEFVLPQFISNQYANNSSNSNSNNKKETNKGNKNKNQTIKAAGEILAIGDEEEQKEQSHERKCHHVRCLPHGVLLTTVAISLAWIGLTLAVAARFTVHFVRLETPWKISQSYQDITSMGVTRAEICYNETVSQMQGTAEQGCFTVPLANNDDIDDPMFSVAAAFSSFSVMMGLFLALFTTTSLCWHTINFRALGVGYVFLYCFQSLTFLYFKTDLCMLYRCNIDDGCIFCILASICWMSSCLLCAMMDSKRFKSDLARERKRRKSAASQQATKKKNTVFSRSGVTLSSERTSSTSSDSDEEADAVPRKSAPTTNRECQYSALSGIQRQHESIIVLENRNHKQHGSNDGSDRGRSKSRTRPSTTARGRSSTQGRSSTHRRSHTRERSTTRGRSTSRGHSTTRGRSQSKNHRSPSARAQARSKSKPRHRSSSRQYTRSATDPERMQARSKSKQHSAVDKPNVHSCRTSRRQIPTSPTAPDCKAKEECNFVTSYFDL